MQSNCVIQRNIAKRMIAVFTAGQLLVRICNQHMTAVLTAVVLDYLFVISLRTEIHSNARFHL